MKIPKEFLEPDQLGRIREWNGPSGETWHDAIRCAMNLVCDWGGTHEQDSRAAENIEEELRVRLLGEAHPWWRQ